MMNDVERLNHAEQLMKLDSDSRTSYIASNEIVETDLEVISQLIIDLGTQQNENQTDSPTTEDSEVCESVEPPSEKAQVTEEAPVEVAEATEEA